MCPARLFAGAPIYGPDGCPAAPLSASVASSLRRINALSRTSRDCAGLRSSRIRSLAIGSMRSDLASTDCAIRSRQCRRSDELNASGSPRRQGTQEVVQPVNHDRLLVEAMAKLSHYS